MPLVQPENRSPHNHGGKNTSAGVLRSVLCGALRGALRGIWQWSGIVVIAAMAVLAAGVVVVTPWTDSKDPLQTPPVSRQEVVFWHFWGGADRDVVEDVARRFNASQTQYHVRPVAMPGNNLDVKVFLSVTGGDPPDLINQDDPVIASWAGRGALLALDEVASPAEMRELKTWLYPAARRLTTYNGRMYGLCNGLDIRLLYYNRTLFEELDIQPPQTLAELDAISKRASLVVDGRRQRFGYLPDSRRLLAWGAVFGGSVNDEAEDLPTVDSPQMVAALDWMQSYSRRYGAQQVLRFRQDDQSLPGKTFPLLPVGQSLHGRYAMILDGQWRVRDIAASQQQRRDAGLPVAEYGVCELPPPPGGKQKAGWANGNFFIIPRRAQNAAGAWAFMKFWSGAGGNEAEAARTCAAGGWIPVSGQVASQPSFQAFLKQQPLFARFVEMAASSNQLPTPVIPSAPALNRQLKSAGSAAMSDTSKSPAELLKRAQFEIQQSIKRQQQ